MADPARRLRTDELGHTLRALPSLVKPRIVALLCLTGVSGLLAAGGRPPVEVVAFVAAGGLIAGGAAALNCYYDRDIDRRMARTADRPLPRGDLDPRLALAFGLCLLAAGTLVGLAALPARSVAFMGLGALAYVGLYTVLLKRRHPIGVVLGGSAGSFPVLAGWTAVRPVEPPALVMAALVFAWTPAHAWALAAVYRDDFAAAGVPTLPVVATEGRVRRAVKWSALATVAAAAALLPVAGPLYAAVLVVAGPLYLGAFRAYWRSGADPDAVRAFFASNLLVAVLFAGWAVDGLLGPVPARGLPVAALATAGLFAWLFRARPALRCVRATAVPWCAHPRSRLERLLRTRLRPG